MTRLKAFRLSAVYKGSNAFGGLILRILFGIKVFKGVGEPTKG
ncbi:MAG: hypothetical protein WBD27_05035 [Pyrinomonadaceae bacterium]